MHIYIYIHICIYIYIYHVAIWNFDLSENDCPYYSHCSKEHDYSPAKKIGCPISFPTQPHTWFRNPWQIPHVLVDSTCSVGHQAPEIGWPSLISLRWARWNIFYTRICGPPSICLTCAWQFGMGETFSNTQKRRGVVKVYGGVLNWEYPQLSSIFGINCPFWTIQLLLYPILGNPAAFGLFALSTVDMRLNWTNLEELLSESTPKKNSGHLLFGNYDGPFFGTFDTMMRTIIFML